MCCCGTTEFLIIAVVVCGLAIPLQVYGKTLDDEFKDFCSIMPNEQIKEIAESHIKTDKEFNEAVIFLQSNTWATMLKDVQQNAEWKQLKKCLNEFGLNLDYMLRSFFNFVGELKPVPNKQITTRSLRGFFDDVELIIPIGKLLAMLHEKKQNSSVFQEFYKKLSSQDVYKKFEIVRKQPEMRRLLIELKSMGARVDDTFELFYGFMNWDSPLPITKRETSQQRNLNDDLEDFKRLIPWDKLKNISDEHLANDQEFGEVVVYFQGPEFAKIVNAVKIRPEYQELKKYLEDAGIDIEGIIKFFSAILLNARPGGLDTEIPKIQLRKARSFRTYLDEIEAAVPVGKLLTLFNDKMEHSEDFKRFVKKISERKVKKMVEDIRELPESKELFEKLQCLGVRIRETLILVYAFLGWGSPFKQFPNKNP